jgi:hypothetical protein
MMLFHYTLRFYQDITVFKGTMSSLRGGTKPET